ncbi:sporulation inhibitor of replication protein SirA [Bacillaceae bacterium S4-13-58]
MHKFKLFLIEPEVYHYYYQRPELVYRFLKQAEEKTTPQLFKQFMYITRPISLPRGWGKVRMMDFDVYIDLFKHRVQLTGLTLPEAEYTIFEKLRELDPCFFVMDMEFGHYGWVSPLQKPVLLS